MRNTGKRAGKEAVLLYSSDKVASQVPEVRRLRDFKKIELQPGEQQTVTFSLPAEALAFVNMHDQWVLEPGEFVLQIENLSATVRCE